MIDKIFKIQDNETGLYAKNGLNWSKKGKIFNGLGPLKNHLNIYLEEVERKNNKLSHWDKYGIIPKEVSASEFIPENLIVIELITGEIKTAKEMMIDKKIKIYY